MRGCDASTLAPRMPDTIFSSRLLMSCFSKGVVPRAITGCDDDRPPAPVARCLLCVSEPMNSAKSGFCSLAWALKRFGHVRSPMIWAGSGLSLQVMTCASACSPLSGLIDSKPASKHGKVFTILESRSKPSTSISKVSSYRSSQPEEMRLACSR